jgi:hypothetical protein
MKFGRVVRPLYPPYPPYYNSAEGAAQWWWVSLTLFLFVVGGYRGNGIVGLVLRCCSTLGIQSRRVERQVGAASALSI